MKSLNDVLYTVSLQRYWNKDFHDVDPSEIISILTGSELGTSENKVDTEE